MKISTDDIRSIVEALCLHLDETGRSVIDVDEDYYWSVPDNEVFDVAKDPVELDVGQLTSDWDDLEKIKDNSMPPVGYGFVWLSSVLRAIGKDNVA